MTEASAEGQKSTMKAVDVDNYRGKELSDMSSIKRKARVAGLWYLLIAILGPIYFVYVPSRLIVPGNATATANNILASESLFRIGIASEVISATAGILLILALYQLLKGVNKSLALLMVIFGVVTTPLGFLSVLNEIAVLDLLSGANFLSVFSKPQLDALVMLFLNLHSQGQFVVNGIFFGLWLLPFGLLVYRSGFFPRILGVWLIINGLAYLVASSTSLFLPSYSSIVSEIVLPFYSGELAMTGWLLVKGAKVPQTTQAQLPTSP